ncbi:MAG: nitroreductase [Ketobacter sp.]|uniref:nitroreductase n=1 Tax=Ketobacter sp. MCCC 1A13808 TaxID=2602738 RepID=UPI0018DCA12A|nr:nitroreductase [Ketobacter sp. MCCC 1A13808]
MSISPDTMTLAQAVNQRRSVRGYLDKEVPAEVLESIFTLAQRAPSNCNIQPWKVYVASGELKNRLRDQMVDLVVKGVPFDSDYDYPDRFDGEYRKRQVECAVELYNHMGIGRGDKEGRMRATLRNFQMFDAPHVVFIGMDKLFGASVAIDVGMYIQTLMLSMTAHGVGSCAQGSMRYYPKLVREAFNLDDDTHILLGISFGYEDTSVAANKTWIDREPLSSTTQFKR